MSPTPIKRNPSLVPLSREHHGTLLFCWKLKLGLMRKLSLERMIRYILWFEKEHLAPHFDSEEQLIFKSNKDPLVKKALDEHREIESLLCKIKKADTKADELIAELSEKINKHTRYEERELFPHLEQTLSAKELEQIGIELAKEPHTADENYDDPFWEDSATKS